jgi:hypothetical protein
MSTTDMLLESKSSGFGLENRDYGKVAAPVKKTEIMAARDTQR